MTTEFTVSQHGFECRITLAQPELDNTLSLEAIRELAGVIREAGRDISFKLIRIRSSGASFCGGRASGKPPAKSLNTAEIRRTMADPILEVYRAMHESEIPVMAEVQGDANGLGCALVAACDLAIASESANFSLPEIEKNVPPTLVLSVLRYKVPPKAAAHMVYLASSIDAKTAREWGFIAEVIPFEGLEQRGNAIAEWIGSRDRLALAAIKTYFREVVIPDFSLASELAGSAVSTAMTSMRDQVPPR